MASSIEAHWHPGLGNFGGVQIEPRPGPTFVALPACPRAEIEVCLDLLLEGGMPESGVFVTWLRFVLASKDKIEPAE